VAPSPGPEIGAHADAILAEHGYTPGEIRALREAGALGTP
jgi:formyl-CoA transferase